MLHLAYYHHTQNLYGLEFINRLKLGDYPLKVIAPGPSLADALRGKISAKKRESYFDLLTINRFIADEISKIESDKGHENYLKKSDLMLNFYTIWKIKLPDYSFDQFIQCFNIFTDLRGFTLKYELIEDVISAFEPQIAKGLMLFWRVCDELNIVDEQKSYSILADQLRQQEDVDPQVLIFWGFQFLGAVQIDLVNAYSIFHEVIIPIPIEVKENAHKNDWIFWPSRPNEFVVDVKKKLNTPKVATFSSGELSHPVASLIKDDTNFCDFFVCTKNPSFEDIQELPVRDFAFKTQVNLHIEAYFDVLKQIKIYFGEREKIETNEVISQISKKIDELTARPIDDSGALKYKALCYLKDKIQHWEELSKANAVIGKDDLLIFEKTCELDAPRNYFVPLTKKQARGQIKGLEALYSFDESNLTIIFLSSKHVLPRGRDWDYPKEVMEFMMALGPFYRQELNIIFLKQKIQEIMGLENSLALIEHGVLESDEQWALVFGHKEIDYDTIHFDRKEKKLGKPSLEKNETLSLDSISASKLQTYIDCPQKFYYKYLENMHTRPTLTHAFDAMEIGDGEHALIEKYSTCFDYLDEQKLSELCHQLMEQRYEKKYGALSGIERTGLVNEMVTYCGNALKVLFEIKNLGLEFAFETPMRGNIEGIQLKGNIDLMARGGDLEGVIDFKRSSFGVPTRTEVLAFKKIQILFYLFNTRDMNFSKKVFFGYLNLSEINDSLFFFSSEQTKKDIFLGFEKIDFSPKYAVLENLAGIRENFLAHQSHLIECMRKEQDFRAEPQSSTTCEYCPMQIICEKENGR